MQPRARHAHIFAKEPAGHYVEPEWCSRRLFEEEPFGRDAYIFDPACGWGGIVREAKAAGYRHAFGSDIINRHGDKHPGFEFRIYDFLSNDTRWLSKRTITSIITNPPFDRVEEFCVRSLQIASHKVAVLCLLRRLPAARWLQSLPLQTIYFLTPRPSMPPGHHIERGGHVGSGTQDFVWLLFDKNQPPFNAWPTFRWLHRDGGRK